MRWCRYFVMKKTEGSKKNVMITVALADDHIVVRQGLRLLLESDPGFVVVGEAANGTEALELVKRKKPNVLIVDLMMPAVDGLEVARRSSRLKSGTRVIILTMYGGEAYLLDALGNGAAGYIAKESCADDLFQAVRDVVAGRCYLSPLLFAAFTPKHLREFRASLLKLSRTQPTEKRKALRLGFDRTSRKVLESRKATR